MTKKEQNLIADEKVKAVCAYIELKNHPDIDKDTDEYKKELFRKEIVALTLVHLDDMLKKINNNESTGS